MNRSAGVIMHISSLPGKFGIGTFGKEAYKFVDFLSRTGLTYWQILPLGPTGYGDSPYQSFSDFAGNPYFIDFDMLNEEGILAQSDYENEDFGQDKESIDYDASKAGVINMGHNLANIYSPYVRVNTVCPGWIDTPMNESINPSFKEKEINKILLKRFARPMEVANLVYFLASEDASYINDSVIKIDGGKVC